MGTVPIFNGLFDELDKPHKLYIAKRVSIISCIAMIGFALAGKFLFAFFSISIDGLKVVSGILLFVVGYDMLQAQKARTKKLTENEKEQIDEMAITPLAIPLVCGPGAISVSILLFQQSHTEIKKALLLLSIVLVSITTFIFLAAGQKIQKFMGPSANKVFTRIMGLIIMMIAVEFFFAGLKPYIHQLMDPETSGQLIKVPSFLSQN